jgi:hypothetical protein
MREEFCAGENNCRTEKTQPESLLSVEEEGRRRGGVSERREKDVTQRTRKKDEDAEK